jgi:hypothetical protein
MGSYRRDKLVRFPTVLVPVALLALVTLSPSVASALVLVSGPSPYATCTIGGPGTNYLNAEVEPWVAVNPANSLNIIGV